MHVDRICKRYLLIRILVTIVTLCTIGLPVFSQFSTGSLTSPPLYKPVSPEDYSPSDSVSLPFKVVKTIPDDYSYFSGKEYASDLITPSNVTLEPVYDPETGMYFVHSRVGGLDIVTPFMMTSEEYNRLATR